MTAPAVVIWIANVLADTGGRMAFKSVAVGDTEQTQGQRWQRMFRSPILWAGILSFCLEFVLWLALLSLIPLSQAILIGSVNVIAVAIAGRLIFGEKVAPLRMAGIVLIAAGVALAGGGG